MSMGVALLDSASWMSLDTEALLTLADQAMYQAKAAGRQAIHVVVPETGEPSAS